MKISILLNSMQSLSAVPLSLARRYMKHFNRGRYANIFNKYGEGKGKDKYRIYIPANASHLTVPKAMIVPKEIEDYLTSLKMTIENYAVGTVKLPDGKRIVRLGKVLAKNAELKKIYDNDPQRRATKSVSSWVVISCHPYDIIGMSFDRGWTSCMELGEGEDDDGNKLGGSNQEFVLEDVKEGTIVAYLIKENDRNINAPTARIAIKPYKSKSHTILVPGNVYGVAPALFSEIVDKFCEYANSGSPGGRYALPDSLYDDGTGQEYEHYTEEGLKTKAGNPFLKMNLNQLVYAARRMESLTALRWLSHSKQQPVREAVAQNIRCPSDILERLANDTDMETRLAVARHRNTPPALIMNFALNASEDEVKRGALRNPAFKPMAWEFLGQNTNKMSAMILAEMLPFTPEQADALINNSPVEWHEDLFQSFSMSRGNIPTETKAHLILNYPENEWMWSQWASLVVFEPKVYERLLTAESESVLDALASCARLPINIQIKLITHIKVGVRAEICRNPFIAKEAIDAYLQFIDYKVHVQVMPLAFLVQRTMWNDDHYRIAMMHPEAHYPLLSGNAPLFVLEHIHKFTPEVSLRNEAMDMIARIKRMHGK